MKCDVHPDRGGILFVDLPSIGVRRWGCFECRASFDKSMLNFKSPRVAVRNCGNCRSLECAECWPDDAIDDAERDDRLDELREFDRHPERYR